MKFLLDENISPKTVKFLKSLGFEAVHVRDVDLRGASDSEVIKFARENGLILITVDKGFTNILHYPPNTHHGIIRLKLKYMPSKIVHSVLERFFKAVRMEEIKGNIIILEKDRFRIRKKQDTNSFI